MRLTKERWVLLAGDNTVIFELNKRGKVGFQIGVGVWPQKRGVFFL